MRAITTTAAKLMMALILTLGLVGTASAQALNKGDASEGWDDSYGDGALEARKKGEREAEFDYFNHGFRLGYMVIMNHDCATRTQEPSTCRDVKKERGLVVPHTMLVGYELTQRLRGSDWLNVIFVESILFAGLEQSAILPSLNLLLGFEVKDQLQVLVGANLVPSLNKTAHMTMAAGWVPDVGAFQLPIHVFFVPDVDGQHRLGASLGVNW